MPTKKDRMTLYGIENNVNLSKIVYDDGLYATILGYDGIETEVGFSAKIKNYAITNREKIKVLK